MANLPDLDLGEHANAFRQEVRQWLAREWRPERRHEDREVPINHRMADQAFSRKLAAKGWLGLSWPKQWGGGGRSAIEALVLDEEMAYAHAPIGWHWASIGMLGPSLMEFGSPAQRQNLLPAILAGDVCFCLGYSEPDNGSDLAGLKTRAIRDGDDWIIRGQKLYTSTAGYANFCWLAARTDPQSRRHGGISVFIVPMSTPGIEIHPLKGLSGSRSNSVFWNDVRVPASAIVGEVNGGWKVITGALAHERMALASIGARARGYFDKMTAHVLSARRNGAPMAADTMVRDRLAQLAVEIEAARLLAVQIAFGAESGQLQAHQAALCKIYSSELMERLTETALDLLGTGAALEKGVPSALLDGDIEYGLRDSLMYTIGGGTNEIQRNLVAIRGLGLPH